MGEEILSYPYPELPHQTVEALGIKTSYTFAGDPDLPLIVLLHGMSNSGDAYREVMHELADSFWLIAPDLPGFGQSGDTEPYTLSHLVEWFASFKDALDLPQMMLLGHSFGGAIVTNYTLFYPADVIRLLLVAPAVFAGELFPDLLKRLAISLGLVDLGTSLSQLPVISDSQSGRPFYDPDNIDESVWSRRSTAFRQSRASDSVLKALAFQNIKSQLHTIEQPVCIIWGEEDPVLPVTQAVQLGEELPNSQVIIYEKCGHMPFLEKQEEFLTTARAFFGAERLT
ncbi:MAG: alpha/beta fold hydrolase [Candidatus Promineifilaceae bacterium]